jgi:hypothetical protein
LKRKVQVGIVSFIVGSLMVFSPTDAFAESVMTTITCANEQGQERTFQVGWDNTHQFFNGRGEIPRLYCEGGYAGSYTTYISDGLPIDSPLRYYNGIVPSPTPVVVVPTPVPSQTPEPEPTASIEPDLPDNPTPTVTPTPDEGAIDVPTPDVVTPTPTPKPVQSESPSPEPSIEPTVEPSPTLVEPTPSPSESVQVEAEPSPTPTITPTPEIVPEETPEPQPTIAIPAPVSDTEQFLAEVSIQLPTYLENVPGIVQLAAAAEVVMAIGSDMTPEQREESQGVVVAAVIVGQLAQVRRLK